MRLTTKKKKKKKSETFFSFFFVFVSSLVSCYFSPCLAMKTKKGKSHSSTARTAEVDSCSNQSRGNAFSFIKNRLFQSGSSSSSSINNNIGGAKTSSHSNKSPRASSSSTRLNNQSIAIHDSHGNKDDDAPLSKSFEEQSTSDLKTNKPARPMSMMGMEGLELIQFDSSRKKNSTTEKRASLIIIKEGYLFKKTDFKPFHKQTKLDRGWKLYKVILRGHKLYLYKVASESPLRSLFPSPKDAAYQTNNASSSSAVKTAARMPSNMKPVKSDFDRQAQEVLFSRSIITQAAVFMELNQVSLQPFQQVHLITTQDGYLYVCSRPESPSQLWKIESKLAISNLRLDFIEYSDTSCSDHLHSKGHLLFNISYVNRPSILGFYSTQYRDSGQAWVSSFQSQTESSRKPGFPLEEEDLVSSRSGGSTSHEEWDDSIVGRMYDATQKDFDLIRKDRAGVVQVQGGTLEALILELLTTVDDEFIDVFLTTYSTFTTGSHLMTTIAHYAEKPGKKDRLLDLMTIWCQRFSLDVMGEVATKMMAILDTISADERALRVKELVLNTVAENSNFLKSLPLSDCIEQQVENIAAYDAMDGKRRDSVNLSNLFITGLTPEVFLILDPTSFAEQVYIFHISQHQQYQQIILNPLSYLPKPQSPVQMLNSLLFTTASPHFLTKLIRSHILIDSQQQEQKAGLLIRSELLEHWIHVGLRLIDLGDMTGWCAVAMGVCSVGIVRLRETWKAVDRSLVKIVQEQWAIILTEHGLFNQNKWSDEWNSDIIFKFAQVLDVDNLKLRQHTGTPSLPFFGTIRQSVDCLKRRINRSFGPGIINFDECRLIHNAIKSGLDDWSEIGQGKPDLKGACVGLPVVAPLQSFFEHSVTDLTSVPHDFKYLQECSLACEPKIFGQCYDRRKFSGHHQGGSDVSPPSSSSLIFPELLCSYRLVDLISIMNDSFDTGANSPSGISQGSSTFVKTHPRKRGKNSSIRSLRSFLDDSQSTKSSLTKNNLRSLQYLPITSSSSYSSLLNGSSPTTLDLSSPSKDSNRKAFRRRTYSFPSGNPNTPPGKNDIDSDHTKTWLGSLISNRYHRTYSTKTLIDTHRRNKSYSGASGEIVLSVQQGELIFKASALLTNDKPGDKGSFFF
jgi:hypothetical protein